MCSLEPTQGELPAIPQGPYRRATPAGTQCPKPAIVEIAQQLADRIGTRKDQQAADTKAFHELGRMVQETYSS